MTNSGLSTVNILLVDDEPANLTVLESVLDDPGYRLVRATTGEQALVALLSDEVAVLVLDVRMPGMSGFELARMLKERRKTARIPIIFLTAQDNDDEQVLDGYNIGAVDYLHKPLNPAVLRSKVAVFAELHRNSRELERANRLLVAEVAERRCAQERLAELNASLDCRVAERTRELQESEARLRDAHCRKDEFLATLAHELRNPLAPVRNAVHFLKLKASASADVQWSTEIIDRQVDRMARLIEDLMDISRINQGRIELRRQHTEIASIVADAVETIQPQIDGNGHKLTLLLPAGPLVVDGDPARLAQVFMNLLSNAARFTDPGGQIELRVVRDGGTAIVTITDSGIGIQPSRLDGVFEMFSQEEAALSRSRGGLGVGLALTRKLVQMHGGCISAHSEGPGKGSRFVVNLPLAELPREVVQHESTPADVDPGAGVLRILVVDDNRDAADTLRTLLELLGHEVRVVHGGEDALLAVPSFDPELVLLDIGMPDLNGYEVCRAIRAREGGAGRTVVAVTGWGQPQDMQSSIDAGFDQHLVKPVEIDQLVRLICKRLRTGGASQTVVGRAGLEPATKGSLVPEENSSDLTSLLIPAATDLLRMHHERLEASHRTRRRIGFSRVLLAPKQPRRDPAWPDAFSALTCAELLVTTKGVFSREFDLLGRGAKVRKQFADSSNDNEPGHRGGHGADSIRQHMDNDARRTTAARLRLGGLNRSLHTILVVDDSAATLYAMARGLRAAGFRTMEAMAGAECMALANRSSAIVLDVHLPDTNGLEVCRLLRADPETARVPVVHVSGVAVSPAHQMESGYVGGDAFLLAPVSSTELAATLEALILSRTAMPADDPPRSW